MEIEIRSELASPSRTAETPTAPFYLHLGLLPLALSL